MQSLCFLEDMLHTAVLLFLIVVLDGANEECFENVLFSTKTPYKLVQNLDLAVTIPDPSCEALHVNMVHRHGNRYPSSEDTKAMKSAAEKINSKGNILPGVNLSLPWNCPFHVEQDKILSSTGENEMYEIGKRIKLRFPGIFSNGYSPLNFSFISSCKLRCTHSASAFSFGLFENNGSLGKCGMQPVAVQTHACDNDPILRFFEICTKYRVNVLKKKEAMKEFYLFKNGPEVQSVLERVNFKLRLEDASLTSDDIWALLIACSYEIGMFDGNKSTGICALFEEEDIRILEYWYDLKQYYLRSAGHKITFESSCPLLRNIVDTLEDFRNNKAHSFIGVFRSAHAETIIPLYALLGVFLGEGRPTSKNFANMTKRHFRAACLSPFSGNIYFVLYKCQSDKYKIQMYLNERIAQIPCCVDKYDCDFESFLKCYKKVSADCYFESICEMRKKLENKDDCSP